MFNGKEVFVEAAQALQTATVVVDDIPDLGHLIVRNAPEHEARIHQARKKLAFVVRFNISPLEMV
jgi:hypothetical protein